MSFSVPTYIPRDSPVHRCDARVKLGLLLAYSITLFFLHSWAGMGLAAVALAIAIAASRLPLRPIVAPLVPLYVLAAITVGLSYLNGNGTGASGWQALNGALLMGARIILLAWASLVFTYSTTSNHLMDALLNGNGTGASGWQALNGALLMGARIILLAWASLVFTYSTTSNHLMDALSSVLRPFRRIGVPADDIALTLSLALRFIPLIAQQMQLVRNAQYSRGAKFGEGPLNSIKAWGGTLIPVLVGLFRQGETLACAMEARCYGAPPRGAKFGEGPLNSIKAWGGTLIPVLVGLFRQGETLACAMEARCYGAPPRKRGGRTLLNRRPFTIGDMAVLVAGIAACALAAFFL